MDDPELLTLIPITPNAVPLLGGAGVGSSGVASSLTAMKQGATLFVARGSEQGLGVNYV
jgi:hypothetical protein